VCCRPRLSLALSLSNMGLTCTPPSPGRRPRPASSSPTLGLPSWPPAARRCPDPAPLPRLPALAPSADTVNHRPARPPQAHARPALDAAAHLPWLLLHPTLSTGRPPTPPASLSRRPAPRRQDNVDADRPLPPPLGRSSLSSTIFG
jgi:hypothetical protein